MASCPIFLLLYSFFPRLVSDVTDWMSHVLPHMVWCQSECRMQVWNVLHAAHWKYRMQKNRQKFAICAPSHNFVGLYLRHWDTYRQSEKNLLNSNISPTCPHNMANFGPLVAEIGSLVWSTPANFNGFRVLASLLHRRHSMEANQTLHDVWPSLWLAHYTFSVQNSRCVQVLHSLILAALLHCT